VHNEKLWDQQIKRNDKSDKGKALVGIRQKFSGQYKWYNVNICLSSNRT